MFVLALILSFKYPRAAAISALIACALSLPLYLYLVFPHPFPQVAPNQWSAPEQRPFLTFVWDGWWIAGILFIAIVVYASARSLARGRFAPSSTRFGA